MNKFFLWLTVAGIAILMASCIGSPEQVEKSNNLKTVITKLALDSIDATKVVESIMEKMKLAKADVFNGKVDIEAGFKMLDDLQADLILAVQKKGEISKDMADAQLAFKALQDSGAGWMVYLGTGVSILFNILQKTGSLKLKGRFGKVASELIVHKGAIEGMSRALFTNNDKNGVLADIKNLEHPVIEDIYKNKVKNA